MTLRSTLVAGLLLGGLSLALPAATQGLPGHEHCTKAGPDGGPGGVGAEMPPPFLRGLKLNEAQQDRVFDLLHAQAKAMRDKAKALQTADMALRQAGRVDDNRLRALVESRAKAWAELTLLRLRSERQILEVLTPEQRHQLEEGRKGREGKEGQDAGPRGDMSAIQPEFQPDSRPDPRAEPSRG